MNSRSVPFKPARISVLNHESDSWSASEIVIFSIAATALPSCDGWSAVNHWIKNGSSRESAISFTPICFHLRSLPSGRVRWPSFALRPNFSSTCEISSVGRTQVCQPPPSCAFLLTALPQGVCSVAGWSRGQTTSMYWPLWRGSVKLRVPNYENYGHKTCSVMTASACPIVFRIILGATVFDVEPLSIGVTRFPCLIHILMT